MSDVRIRPAQEQDAAVILRLITALGEYEKLRHEVVATEADVHAALFGAHPAAEVMLACATRWPDASPGEPEEAVGFALFFHNFSTFLGRRGMYLEDLFVVPEWRGRGIGRRLLAHLARLAIERNCGRMEWAVLDWNEPAIGFYERLGARVMDDWRICRLTGEGLTRLAASSS